MQQPILKLTIIKCIYEYIVATKILSPGKSSHLRCMRVLTN